MGGLHGNEPAGVLASQRVLARLEQEDIELAGTLAAVAGNVGALAAGRRFLKRDLNRSWLPTDIARLASQQPEDDEAEQTEMRALAQVIAEEAARTDRLVIVDLHTTSGDSPPFSLMSDTLRNRRLARALPVPVILGLEENVDGTLLEYATERGHTVLVVESGRHDDPAAVDLHESVIWLAAAAAELLPPTAPHVVKARARLHQACRGLPPVAEVRHRHDIAAGADFKMELGYRGFQPVERGELLGRDRAGPIHAPSSGLILMPLYQDQGDDGYFLIRRVSRFWLWLSALLRRLKLARMMLLLPGVERHPARDYALRVNPRVARWFVVEIFHLFGYRKRRREGDHLVFTRRTPG